MSHGHDTGGGRASRRPASGASRRRTARASAAVLAVRRCPRSRCTCCSWCVPTIATGGAELHQLGRRGRHAGVQRLQPVHPHVRPASRSRCSFFNTLIYIVRRRDRHVRAGVPVHHGAAGDARRQDRPRDPVLPEHRRAGRAGHVPRASCSGTSPKQPGLANYLLERVGPGRVEVPRSRQTITWVVIGAIIWASSGFYITILMAAVDRIPPYLYEDAEMAGASPWQKFRNVTLPLTWDVVGVAGVLWTINAHEDLRTGLRARRTGHLLAAESTRGRWASTCSTGHSAERHARLRRGLRLRGGHDRAGVACSWCCSAPVDAP